MWWHESQYQYNEAAWCRHKRRTGLDVDGDMTLFVSIVWLRLRSDEKQTAAVAMV